MMADINREIQEERRSKEKDKWINLSEYWLFKTIIMIIYCGVLNKCEITVYESNRTRGGKR